MLRALSLCGEGSLDGEGNQSWVSVIGLGGSAGSLSQWVLGLVGYFSPVWGPGRGQGKTGGEGRSWFCGPGADEEGETQKFHVKVRPWAAWLQSLCT